MKAIERAEQLMPFVERLPWSGCWIWLRGLTHEGYGRPYFNGKVIYAHRLFFIAFNGPLRREACVLHRCDVRCCVNPAHLFVGSRRDNMLDMWGKGRGRTPGLRGVEHGCVRLTEEQVLAIRKEKGASHVVAPKYGVASRTIRAIRTGELWAHLPQ